MIPYVCIYLFLNIHLYNSILDSMENLLFHSNPLTRTEDETRQLNSGGWKKYNSRLFYEHVLETVIVKANKAHKYCERGSKFSSYLNNKNIFSREFLLSCIYEMFCSFRLRKNNDYSPTIISLTFPYRKNKNPLWFVELSIPSIPTDLDRVWIEEMSESERLQCGLLKSKTLSKPVNTMQLNSNKKRNNQKIIRKANHVTDAQNSETNETIQKEQDVSNDFKRDEKKIVVIYNPLLSDEHRNLKNVFFKYNLDKNKFGCLFDDYDVIDVIIWSTHYKYLSTLGGRRKNMEQYIRDYLYKPIGQCKWTMSMFFKDHSRLIEFVRTRLNKKHEYKWNKYEQWSIDPKKNHVSQCEASARTDKWLIFLAGLKNGITRSAYMRILDAFEFYLYKERDIVNNIPYLNGKSIKNRYHFNLDDYSERYDHLRDSARVMSSMSTVTTDTVSNSTNENASTSACVDLTENDVEKLKDLVTNVSLDEEVYTTEEEKD